MNFANNRTEWVAESTNQGDFRFEEEFFLDPKAMVDELKSMGIELMVSVWPQIDHHSENFKEMRQKGYLNKAERGSEIPVFLRDGKQAYLIGKI